MNIRYFGYYFEKTKTRENFSHPIQGLLDAYCDYSCTNFKNSITHNGEKVFLLRERSKHYLFLKTKDLELIKTINRANIQMEEITQKLSEDESIGFASHLYVDSNFMGFASTMLAPTITAFTYFINQILLKLSVEGYNFVTTPLVQQITREKARKMHFVGATSVRINHANSLFQDILNVVSITEDEALDLGFFELKLITKRNKDIKASAKKILDIPPSGIDLLQIRAKNELHERLIDYRIENSLVLRDIVDRQSKVDIFTQIEELVLKNKNIAPKVQEYINANGIGEVGAISALSKFNSTDNWPEPSVGADHTC